MTSISRFVRGHPVGCALVTIACITAGYADLWRGGTSWASALLVIGYVGLMPLALRTWYMARAEPGTVAAEGSESTPPYRTAVYVGAGVLLLYVVTLAPSTAMWDTSEYMAVARVLGIPHPPGNPVFVLVAHAFALLPIPVPYAARVNLLAAVTSAVSAALWFLVTYRCLRGAGLPQRARLAVAAAGTWLGATAFSVWNQSVVNEKVYTLAMLGVAASAWLALRWFDAQAVADRNAIRGNTTRGDRSRSADLHDADSLLVIIAYLCGLGYANHPAGFLPLPAVGLFVLLRRPSTVLRWRTMLVAAVALCIGLTPFAYLPVRASHNPAINEGELTACVGGPRLDCIFSATTWSRLKGNIQREQYGGHAVAERQTTLAGQFGMWWQYFEWQWWRDAFGTQRGVQQSVAVFFLLLAALGAVMHWKGDRDSFLFIAPLIFTLTPALIFYLNFKYGWSQALELGNSVPREVRDRDYFYVWSFASLAVWMATGIAALYRWAARLLPATNAPGADASSRASLLSRHRYLVASPLLLIALVPALGNYRYAPRNTHRFTAAWARDLLGSVEPYAILITNGDNDSFPLWYAQQVEGIRRDVSVVLTPYLGSDWYPRLLIRSKVEPYAGAGLPAYAPLALTVPTAPMFSLSEREANEVPPYMQFRETQQFSHGRIRALIPAGVLTRDQLLVLRLIADVFPQRPVYFSLGNYPHQLGLGEHIVSQGLAQRLTDAPAASIPGVMSVGGGYIDLERSNALWASYLAPKALLDDRDWIDDASIVIPSAYVGTGQFLAQALGQRGLGQRAEVVYAETMLLARKLRLVARNR